MANNREGFNYDDYVETLKSLNDNYAEGLLTEKEFRKGLAKVGLTATEIDEVVRVRNEAKTAKK